MNKQERRRYFRINETVGLSIQILDDGYSGKRTDHPDNRLASTAAALTSQNDERIDVLISELADLSPKVAELAALINQKMERVVSMLTIDNHLLDRIAHKVQEVNISACGLAFSHDQAIPENSRIRIELKLLPDEIMLSSDGVVVSCERTADDPASYYCRVDFLGMSASAQEELIQFVVQSQSAQLKARKNEFRT